MNEDNLEQIIQRSESNDLVKKISSTMHGKTFHHHYHILYDIRTYLGSEKKIYTEIGSYCGGSLSLMLQNEFDTELHSIDPLHVLDNQENILMKNIEKFNKYNRKVHVHKEFSTNQNFIKNLEKNNFKTDILFIDGDHSYQAVQNDFYQFENFVNDGGFIIFDDYLDYKYSPQVKKSVDDIIDKLDKNKYKVYGSFKNYKDVFTNGYDEKFLHLNEFIIQKKI